MKRPATIPQLAVWAFCTDLIDWSSHDRFVVFLKELPDLMDEYDLETSSFETILRTYLIWANGETLEPKDE